MKKFILYTASFFATWMLSITSCKKDSMNYSVLNRYPVAIAGADISVVLSSCTETNGFAELDGTASHDPENNIVSYIWTYISGPLGFVLKNSTSAKARAENLSSGIYCFELSVRDAEHVSSKDTVRITVTGPVKEYDFDITLNSTFNFKNNYEDCDYYYYYPCSYYDLTQIIGKSVSQPFGEMQISVSEIADTSDLSVIHSTTIYINDLDFYNLFINGTCSVNFKKLIQQGGGAFNGIFTITNGSAEFCDPNAFRNVSHLEVTGSLDTVTTAVTLRIKGKIYF